MEGIVCPAPSDALRVSPKLRTILSSNCAEIIASCPAIPWLRSESEAATAAEGLFMHSDVANHGNVSIDDSTAEGRILAAVHASVVQTQACNVYSIPTDCPQREKRTPHRGC